MREEAPGAENPSGGVVKGMKLHSWVGETPSMSGGGDPGVAQVPGRREVGLRKGGIRGRQNGRGVVHSCAVRWG